MKRLMPLILIILILCVSVSAQDEPVISPALSEQMESIETLTSELRGLELMTPLTRRFPAREELIDYLTGVFDEELPEDEAQRELQFYVAFDLLPPDTDLRAVYLELYSDQVAGFYDSEAKEMNVILIVGGELGDELPLLEEITYSHEYVHALQDQYFDLEGIINAMEEDENNIDGMLAMISLIEGDATLAMMQYTMQRTQENPGLAMLQILFQGAMAGGLALPENTPPIIASELMFPYEDGMEFVAALYNSGGWEMVNAAFNAPPLSTEHIIHPERYIDGDMPQEVALLPDENLLGAEWELLFERTLGEYYLRQYLGTQLDSAEVKLASTGWGGDRYRLYQQADTGQLAWVMQIVWDTPEDAAEFGEIYTTFVNSRMGNPMNTPCWSNAGEEICFMADEAGAVIAYAPTHEMALALLENQRR